MTWAYACALLSTACSALIGLDDLQLEKQPVASPEVMVDACVTNRDCNVASGPGICRMPERRCVPLQSSDCVTITGDYLDDRAILLGSLFTLSGATATTNVFRQSSAALAIEEINLAGGVPQGSTSANARPLVLVSCDAGADLMRAAEHLIKDLGVPAIIGPSTSQDTLDLSSKLSASTGTLLLTPTAVAASIADLLDGGLTWQMVPSDVQRGPLMVQQINDLEAQLRKERKHAQIKLGVIFRDDALGVGTFAALSDLTLNGKPLADAINLGTNVFVDSYRAGASEQRALVDAYARFAPDILVLVGTSEVVTQLMVPIEQAWRDATPRPHYLLTDSTKVSELLDAVSDNDDLRQRVRGTGVTPSARSQPVFNAFRVSYELRYPGATANVSGMGPSYDAAYALAFALAASKSLPVSGTNIAAGLRQLSGGATEIQLQETQVLAAFQRLSLDQSIDAVGTFGPLAWTENGAIQGGTVEMWCVGRMNDSVGFQGSGVTLEIETGKTRGMFVQCP